MPYSVMALFCDDIRQESSGKQTLVGVYGPDLVPSVIPCTFPVSVWVRLNDVAAGPHTFRFSLWLPEAEKQVDLDGHLNQPEDASTTNLNFVRVPIHVNGYDQLIAKLKLDDLPEVEIGRLRVAPPRHSTSS